MKKLFLYFICVIGLVAVWGCEDVIDVQTTEAPRQLVVDAWLTNLPQQQEISITFSQGYFDDKFAANVGGAFVTVVSRAGVFDFEGDGIYRWTPKDGEVIGKVGDTCILNVVLPDQELSAFAVIHPTPFIDSIGIEYRENDFRGPDGRYAQFYARDFPGLGNCYWIKAFKNHEYLNKPDEINLAFDAGFDQGSDLDGIVFIPPIRELINPVPDDLTDEDPPYDTGDLVRVEIHSISRQAFNFMSSVRDEIQNGSNGIFATPISNSRGNIISSAGEEILGAFNVAAVSMLEREID